MVESSSKSEQQLFNATKNAIRFLHFNDVYEID